MFGRSSPFSGGFNPYSSGPTEVVTGAQSAVPREPVDLKQGFTAVAPQGAVADALQSVVRAVEDWVNTQTHFGKLFAEIHQLHASDLKELERQYGVAWSDKRRAIDNAKQAATRIAAGADPLTEQQLIESLALGIREGDVDEKSIKMLVSALSVKGHLVYKTTESSPSVKDAAQVLAEHFGVTPASILRRGRDARNGVTNHARRKTRVDQPAKFKGAIIRKADTTGDRIRVLHKKSDTGSDAYIETSLYKELAGEYMKGASLPELSRRFGLPQRTLRLTAQYYLRDFPPKHEGRLRMLNEVLEMNGLPPCQRPGEAASVLPR